jgi:Ferritin-like domain
LLKLGVGGGAGLFLTGGSALTGRASAADAPPDGDLAYLRLLIGAELLAIDFHTRALAARSRLGAAARTFARALADERAHYARLARLLQNAGQTPAGSGDVDFHYPRGAFATRRSIARLGWRIESLLLGAYLGAIESLETQELRLPIGQIAANEAQHVSALAPLLRQRAIGAAFPAALTMSTVSATLDGFES